MPFQSEKQRRYLWANEPEIARDWTDTYGSRIEANLGGIMRLGYLYGGLTHPDGRRGFFTGAQADASAGRGAMSPGTGMTGGARHGGPKTGDHHPKLTPKEWTPGADTSYTHNPTHTPQTKGFMQRGIDLYNKYGLVPNAFRMVRSIFTPQTPEQKLQSNINKGYDVNNPAEMHGAETRTGPTTGPDRGDQQYIPPQYINDLYAQNVMEEDGLDIDTSTGNMEDWSQRFRVDDPYRQDQGTLDPQIREYISTLYT